MIEIGFQKCTLQNHAGPPTGLAVQYKWDVMNSMQERVSLSSPETDLMFHSATRFVCTRSAGRTMPWTVGTFTMSTTQWDSTLWKISTKMWTGLMTPTVNHPFLIDVFQIFPDNTAMLLKNTALLPDHVHTFLINCCVTYRKRINRNGLSSVGFLPIQFEATVEGDAKS